MRKWAYRVDDKNGDFRITNVALKNLKPVLVAARVRANASLEFGCVVMSRPLTTLLIENALSNTYRLQDVTTITVKTHEG